MSNVETKLTEMRNGFDAVVAAVEEIANQPVPVPTINDRSLSGNKINGGTITNFNSVGIADEATETVLRVTNDGIISTTAHIQNIPNSVSIRGDVRVAGELHAQRLQVDEISADIRNERTSPLEFKAENGSLRGKGLIFTGVKHTRQFAFQENPDRFFSSESIDLQNEKEYKIAQQTVLTQTRLGDGITQSNLTQVGTLENLHTEGHLNVDNFVFFDADSMRLGVGTDVPNGQFSVKSFEHEFIVEPVDSTKFKTGTWTTSALQIITDDEPRIEISANGNIVLNNKVTMKGQLAIGVNNPSPEVDITTARPVRFQEKLFEVGDSEPSYGSYNRGDIVWNTAPNPTGYVGWICTKSGTPGIWKPFGQISS